MDNKSKLKNRCVKIIESIKESYPVLKDARIHIHLWTQSQGSMASFYFLSYHIFVDYKKWEEAADEELTGTLAHELVHLEHNKTTSYSRLFKELILYYTSPKARRKIERTTDIITIKKGFGKQLLKSSEFRIKMDKNALKFMKKYYLMPVEIKSILKKK